eukprot:3622682-Pyramimonas_sp.AAC.1
METVRVQVRRRGKLGGAEGRRRRCIASSEDGAAGEQCGRPPGQWRGRSSCAGGEADDKVLEGGAGGEDPETPASNT